MLQTVRVQTRALVQAADLLAEIATDASPLIVDVRWSLSGADRAGYAAGHLPGAVFCDLDAELAGPPGDGGRHPLPTPEQMTELMCRLGIWADRRVVVLDGGAGAAAARAWWCLRWAGHEDVRVLDGGLPAWAAAGGPVEVGDVDPVPTDDVVVRAGSMPTVTADEVQHRRVGRLLDARAPERYRGEVEPLDPVAGHIPGAANHPMALSLEADGRFKDAASLRAAFASTLGDRPVATVIQSCGSGVTACHGLLAMEVAGLPGAALYAGSWSAWCADPLRPVARG